jgi:hypothetical protein
MKASIGIFGSNCYQFSDDCICESHGHHLTARREERRRVSPSLNTGFAGIPKTLPATHAALYVSFRLFIFLSIG